MEHSARPLLSGLLSGETISLAWLSAAPPATLVVAESMDPGIFGDDLVTQVLVGAAGIGDLATMRSMLCLGADPLGRDDGMNTPLMQAARGGQLDAVQMMLAYGGSNATDWLGKDAKQLAQECGHGACAGLIEAHQIAMDEFHALEAQADDEESGEQDDDSGSSGEGSSAPPVGRLASGKAPADGPRRL